MNIRKGSVAAATLITGTLLASSAPAAVGTPHLKADVASTPALSVTMSSKPTVFKVTGPRTLPAGQVDLTLVAGTGEQEFAVMRLHNGYTMAELRKDFATFGKSERNPTPAGLAALRHVVHNTTFYGGIDSGVGHKTVSASVTLPKAGTYYVINDNNGPGGGAAPVKLNVTAPVAAQPAPTVAVVQTATTAKRFTGPVNLPASGTVEFRNASTSSPHFMFLQHVKTGTTRKQVINAFKSNGGGPELPGAVGTDVVFMGLSMTLTYTLPAGDYAELCFFPDLKTGMPHAFMGMVRIVHLS